MFDDGVLVSLFYKQSDIYKEDQKNKFKPWTRYGSWINHKNCIELIIKKRFFEWIWWGISTYNKIANTDCI